MEQEQPQKHPGGRPTKYDPAYCKLLIEHMASGLSFQSFAGLIHTNIDTLYEWKQKYPEFSDAEKAGRSECMLFWEKMGVTGTMAGKIFNDRSWKFNMQNRFGWKDRQDITSNDEKVELKITITEAKHNSDE